MRKLIVGILFLGLFTFSACDKIEESCKEKKNAAALVSDFPDSLFWQKTYSLEIEYVLDNGCGKFDSLIVTETSKSVDVVLQTVYEGCNCTQQLSQKTIDFPIHHSTPGVYEYRFWVGKEQWDTYSLKVYQ